MFKLVAILLGTLVSLGSNKTLAQKIYEHDFKEEVIEIEEECEDEFAGLDVCVNSKIKWLDNDTCYTEINVSIEDHEVSIIRFISIDEDGDYDDDVAIYIIDNETYTEYDSDVDVAMEYLETTLLS